MYKVIRYDLRYGVLEGRRKLLLAVGMGGLVLASCYVDFVALSLAFTGEIWGFGKLNLSLGDVIIYGMGGNFGRTGSGPLSSFVFPTLWYLSVLFPCYMTLTLAADDISAGGVQIMSRLRGRGRWWLSKCVLCAALVALYYVSLYALLWLVCALAGFGSDLVPNEAIFATHFNGVRFVASETTPAALFAGLIVQPILVTVALCLTQMAMTLFVKPIYALIAVAAYLAASTLVISPAFAGNFAMPLRSSAIGVYNFDFLSCLILCAALSLIAVLLGQWKITKTDII